MNFYAWLAEVVRLADLRGITASWRQVAPGWVTFTWQCRTGPSHGIAGAGVEMIGLTSPAAFIEYWRCEPAIVTLGRQQLPEESGQVRRVGRFVPYLPARATCAAIREIF